MGHDVALDHPGEISWFKSDPQEEFRKPAGPCPHGACPHNAQSTVAWGPDFERYELVVCDVDGPQGCASMCRGWLATDDNSHGGTHGPKYRLQPAFMLMDRPPARQRATSVPDVP